MIYEFFKVSDANESVSDLNEVFKVELKNDTVQSFNTQRRRNHNRDEAATRHGNSGQFILPSASTVKTEEAIAVSVHSRSCSGESRDYTRCVFQWWFDTWSRKIMRSISLLVKDNLKKPASGASAAKGQAEGKGKRSSEDCVREVWTS